MAKSLDNTQQPHVGWRDRKSHGHSRKFVENNADAQAAAQKPPSMVRSRIQLSTTYAPGVLFTWEGAKGICRSVPIVNEADKLEEATKLLIYDGMKEFASNWFNRASQIRQPDTVPTRLILDDPFYDLRTGAIEPNTRVFQFTDPGVMGYVPYPLLYRCGTCGHLEEYSSLADQHRHPLPRRCGDHDARWTQVDVVYVHWSGHVEPLSPFRNEYSSAHKTVSRIDQCKCGSRDFRLNNAGPVFSEWSFTCESCGKPRDLQQHDPLTYEVLQQRVEEGGRKYEFIEVNMLPVSYRAHQAFYPQKSAFIEFRDRCVVDLLLPERQPELLRRVAQIHNFPYSEPSEEEIEKSLTNAGKRAEWEDYRDHLEMADRASGRNQTARAEQLRRDAAALKEGWYGTELISRGQVQSPALTAAVADRNAWARRYDPLRLTVEHNRFCVEHVEERRARHEAISVLEPDRLICSAVGDPIALGKYKKEISQLLNGIGLDDLVLIRGLPVCEYSFGYSRVSATPIYVREFNNRLVPMPVRLNAFPEMPNSHHPIYVTQQRNEALYFKVNEERVRRWLVQNNIADVPSRDQKGIGAAYLEQYADFGAYLEAFKGREGLGSPQRALPPYVYLLLHTLAHQTMHSLTDISGLDRDGLSEYIFPADLAFVVYRKGMTPDLGNISAMWRNHGADFLRRMLDARLLRCGSGSLCDTRGGACPACIMVSEVSCIGANQLLSRAALRGGPPPNWEPHGSSALVGFFDPTVKR